MRRRDGVVFEGRTVHTSRLRLRPWSLRDAPDALAVYGRPEVARWLAPAMSEVPDEAAMEAVLRSWVDDRSEEDPLGRWAIEVRSSGEVLGGVSILPLPPDSIDQEIAVQVVPTAWGKGIGSEAGHALAHFAFSTGLDEIFAVTRPANRRAASMARAIGMEWVGETEKYYGLRLDVFRLRKGDLDIPGGLDVPPGVAVPTPGGRRAD